MKKKLVLLILSVVLGITVIFLIVLLGSKTVTVQEELSEAPLKSGVFLTQSAGFDAYIWKELFAGSLTKTG